MNEQLAREELVKIFENNFHKIIHDDSIDPLIIAGKILLSNNDNDNELLIIANIFLINEMIVLKEDIRKLTNLMADK